MKWFKHISDSLDDPFIFNLIEKHDANGYLVFFGILEIYAREFKTDADWKLSVTLPYLRKKLNRTRNKLITNVLRTLGELDENFQRTFNKRETNLKVISNKNPKWEITICGDDVTIFIPKFRELMDESTLKKLRESEKSFRNDSGTIPPDAPTDKDKEEDIPPTPLVPYPSVISKELWEAFVEHRRVTIKKPLTVQAAQITIRKLERWKAEGYDPVSIVEDAIANGWRGVFKPKEFPIKGQKKSW
jgi:hypothetical protein